MGNEFTRKTFLQRSAVFGAAGLAATTFLANCGGRNPDEDEEEEVGSTASACGDVSGLSPVEKQSRAATVTAGAYVEVSPDAAKNCANCQLYKEPAAGTSCGGCQLFAGPVAPLGYCNSWAAKIG